MDLAEISSVKQKRGKIFSFLGACLAGMQMNNKLTEVQHML